MPLFAAVEAGGTTFVAAVIDSDPKNILEKISVDTRKPDDTINDIIEFFNNYLKNHSLKEYDALGVASFGPVDLKKESKTYGYITSTPKEHWKNYDILGNLRKGLNNINCFEFDTDVNGAALAMAIHFSNKSNIDSLAYCTVGTGVGVGILSNNQLVHGLLHPEAGHIYLPRAIGDSKENFKGTCPFHGDCLEGLVASGSLSKRKNIPAKELASLSNDDEIWNFTAFYLAHLSITLASTVSPQVIVLGGGIMQREILFPKIRSYAKTLTNGYLNIDFESIIQPSPFGLDAGIIGAGALAKNAFDNKIIV